MLWHPLNKNQSLLIDGMLWPFDGARKHFLAVVEVGQTHWPTPAVGIPVWLKQDHGADLQVWPCRLWLLKSQESSLHGWCMRGPVNLLSAADRGLLAAAALPPHSNTLTGAFVLQMRRWLTEATWMALMKPRRAFSMQSSGLEVRGRRCQLDLCRCRRSPLHCSRARTCVCLFTFWPPPFWGRGGRWMWFGTQLYTVHGKACWGAGDGRTHPGGLPPLLPRWRQTCITHLPQFIPQTRQAAKSPCKACIYLLYGQFTSHFHRGDDNIYELPMTPPDWASVRLHKSAEPLSFTQPPGSEWQPQLWTGGSQPWCLIFMDVY